MCCINTTVWPSEILWYARNCGMLNYLKTSISLLMLDCSLKKKIHFHSRKMNVLLLTNPFLTHAKEGSEIVVVPVTCLLCHGAISLKKLHVSVCCYMLLSWEYFIYQHKVSTAYAYKSTQITQNVSSY